VWDLENLKNEEALTRAGSQREKNKKINFSMNTTTTQLLSSGEFCKLRCDTIPVKSASANVSFYTNN
jgi:hypothetical protein